jgi:hypothetical protein
MHDLQIDHLVYAVPDLPAAVAAALVARLNSPNGSITLR